MLGELDARQIEEVLRQGAVGRIGCHAGGRTYVVPITYAYDGECVYGHSAEGQKIRMMRANPAVCFEVDQMEDLANWRSVIAQGTFEELRGAEAEAALHKLTRRLLPLVASETSFPAHGFGLEAPVEPGPHEAVETRHPAILYRIRLTEKCGRFEAR
jgi:nitroimidazol reductase NimA-like FMN-containing flavoprotein (pyridoxamine 5'-phosphate oxidase superfamily)